MQVRTKLYIFLGFFSILFLKWAARLSSANLQLFVKWEGKWERQLQRQGHTRKNLLRFVQRLRIFLKESRVTKGTSQGRYTIRPAFLRGSPLRKVTWKAGRLQEGRPEHRLQQYARRVTVRAWNPLGEFSFPSDISIFTPSKNANKLDGVHSGTKLSTFSGLL